MFQIHQYKSHGYNLVLDVNSGSVHIFDDAAYDMLPQVAAMIENDRDVTEDEVVSALVSGGKFDPETVRETVSELFSLKDNGSLFADDIYEKYIGAINAAVPVVKALCLHIAHDCNLACSYCFAGKGDYSGEREMMSYETGKAALDFLVKESRGRRNLEVDFFGGEPLMNWDVVKQLVLYGRSLEKEHDKNFRFTLTTNGLLLDDEKLDFMNREMGNLVLSVDGRRSVHDRLRKRRDGGGSYDLIIDKFVHAAESRNQDRYYVRGTFTAYNKDFSKDVESLADLGFKQISMEPVVAERSEPYAITESDLDEIIEEYDRLCDLYLERRKEGRGFNFFHFNIDLAGGPCVAKRLSGCGSGCEYLSVTPDGKLYPCHQFAGKPEFVMGDVHRGIVRDDIRDDFRKCNVYTRPECRKCFARYYCSGGCQANAFNENGDINSVYEIGCILERKRIECAIMLQAAQADEI
ncbi:MAG: thioether cross-link-forming SCIFF peptide maturase [Lachnospiraceae bacterium]|nr:thioether cross-link-forming SCIFF peptide maturase [Lachnospiraceae bacterium]